MAQVKPGSDGRTARRVAAPVSAAADIYEGFVGGDAVKAVRGGLLVAAADVLLRSGAITSGEFYEVVMPRKTLANRRASGRLTADQSDRLVRVARVIAKAEESFGDREKAHFWLRRPTGALGGEAPLGLLDTETGARKAEDLLMRIDHGIAA